MHWRPAKVSKMIRAAIYARFSTELQNEKSVEDQITLCRAYAKREGMLVVGEFYDKAKSGGSMHGRDGLMDLMQLANAQAIDVVIVESQDRLSRDMEDTAHIFKRLTFLNIKLVGVHDGEANTLTVGMRAIVAQMFREDNVKKVRRGMSGLLHKGLSAGGKAYGYRPNPYNAGKPQIVDAEARIVAKVFEDYVAGKSPKSISHELNARGITPPRGNLWSPSTLIGEASRGSGILRNALYRGEIVWNKVTMVKDPNTGRRLIRPNPPELWERAAAPELRIVSDELWYQAQEQLAARSNVGMAGIVRQKRPTRLLSGLIKCGACGAGMAAAGKDKSGRTRLRCSAHTNSGSCPAPKTFYLDLIEGMVLESLTHHLKDPDLMAAFLEEYQAERRRLNGSKISRKAEIEKRIAFLDKDNDRLMDWALRDAGDPERLLAKMKEQKAEMDRLAAELSTLDEAEVKVDLHPAAIRRYTEALVSLQGVMRAAELDGDSEAAKMVRELVNTVTVYDNPGTKKGVRIKVDGSFSAFAEPPKGTKFASVGGSVPKLVAEVRYGLNQPPGMPGFWYGWAA